MAPRRSPEAAPARVPLTMCLCHCTDDSADGTVTASLSCEECGGAGIVATIAGDGFTIRARRTFCQCAEAYASAPAGAAEFGCSACHNSGLAVLTMEAVEARGERLRALATLRAMARELGELEGVEERRALAAAGLSCISDARFYGAEDEALTAAASILGAVGSLRSDAAAHEAARTLAAILDVDAEVSPTRGSTAAAA